MSHLDEQPFLDAILARYHDDGPRLVYADWLEETGEPLDLARAELIRVQIALARLPDDHVRLAELANRQTELLQQHRATWTAHFVEIGAGVEFRRGIPDAVSIDAATFIERGSKLFQRGPVRRVRLEDAARVMPALIQCPYLASVDELDLSVNDLGNGGLNLLLRSPHIGSIRVLELGLNGIDDDGIALLAGASTLCGLQELSLNDNGQITAGGVRVLVDSPYHAGLTSLDLSGNDVNETGVAAIIRSRTLASLCTLRLHGNPIGDTGVTTLLRSEVLARVLGREPCLDWRENAIGPVGAVALSASDLLARVAHLDLSGNYLGDRGAKALATSGRLTNLRTLRLARNQITDTAAAAIAATAADAPYLRLLDMTGNRLTPRGIEQVRATASAGGFVVEIGISANGRPAPVAIQDVLPSVLQDMVTEEVAALRRKVTNPARRTELP